MSVREEEERNKNCPSRGLGIAAAAIGVGVGAALYYFFNNRNESPAGEGATTSRWQCEEPHVLATSIFLHNHPPSNPSRQLTDSESSFTTISEHSTTDTSMVDSSDSEIHWHHNSNVNILQIFADHFRIESDSEDSEGSVSNMSGSDMSPIEITSDSDTNMEWDVTTSSLDVPGVETQARSPIAMLFGVSSLIPHSSRWNRERSWSLEECSICFDIMLKEQDVMSLACTHRFHQACIMPWLEQKQTCPNCRKAS